MKVKGYLYYSTKSSTDAVTTCGYAFQDLLCVRTIVVCYVFLVSPSLLISDSF